MECSMSKKKHTAEEIIGKLREAEALQSKGQGIAKVCRQPRIAEQTYYRWRKELEACGLTKHGSPRNWRGRIAG